MARGSDTKPESKCWPKLTKAAVVLHEQDSHRDVSEAKSPGFAKGKRGSKWQSHHLLCICAMEERGEGKDSKAKQELDDALYGTVWNINEEKNMLGMPQKKAYREAYIKIERMAAKLQAAEWAKATRDKGDIPANIPAHNIDHNQYTTEVIEYLKAEIWNKYKQGGKSHEKRAEWLKKNLETASEEFQRRLLEERAPRKGGTVQAWQNRFKKPKDKFWAAPFSMAVTPLERFEGRGIGKIVEIFKRLGR